MVRCDRCIYERDCSRLRFDGRDWMLCDKCKGVVERRRLKRGYKIYYD